MTTDGAVLDSVLQSDGSRVLPWVASERERRLVTGARAVVYFPEFGVCRDREVQGCDIKQARGMVLNTRTLSHLDYCRLGRV